MTSLLLATALYTSPQLCVELAQELQAAVDRLQMTFIQAEYVSKYCRKTYAEGR